MRRSVVILALCLATPAIAARDARSRLNALRSVRTEAPAQRTELAAKRSAGLYRKPTVDLALPPGLGRRPTSLDVTVLHGFDGRTPDQALEHARSKLTTPLLPENRRVVDETLRITHKAFTLAVNNAFVPGSPLHGLLNGDLAGADVSILGTVSQGTPTVIMAKKPGERLSRYYVNDGGTFKERPTLPFSVAMKARLENGSKGGLRLTYQRWSDKRLAGKLGEIIEIGSPPATPATP